MGGPFNSGLDCMEAAQPKELSCNVTSNNNRRKNASEFGLPGQTFTLLRFFLLKGFSKASSCWAGKPSWTQPPRLFPLPHPSSFSSLFAQEVSRIKVSLTHKDFYLGICPSLTCHLPSEIKQSNLSIQCPPLISFQMFFKTSALDLLFFSFLSLRSLSTCGGLGPAGKGPCEALCKALVQVGALSQGLCCANRGCQKCNRASKKNHTRRIYVCHLIVGRTHTLTHTHMQSTDTGCM